MKPNLNIEWITKSPTFHLILSLILPPNEHIEEYPRVFRLEGLLHYFKADGPEVLYPEPIVHAQGDTVCLDPAIDGHVCLDDHHAHVLQPPRQGGRRERQREQELDAAFAVDH